MQPSVVGLIVCVVLMLVGRCAGSVLIIGLIASLAFGATAFATLTALGGASPLIYVCFSAALVASVALRRRAARDIGKAFGQVPMNWMLLFLLAYAIIGAVLFPRLFAGHTSVFVLSAVARSGTIEMPLAPVTGNITQSGYFALSVLTGIGLCILLLHRDRLQDVRRGFFLFCGLHAAMGLIDFLAKTAGLGDVLAPIRTANYAMLTDAGLAGFVRIAGGQSEASAFAAVTLSCIAFTCVCWIRTNDRLAKWLTLVLLFLLLLSTSTTAYVGVAILGPVLFLSIGRSILSDRLRSSEALVVALVILGSFGMIAIALTWEGAFDPVAELLDTTLVNKGSSDSGRERTYMNVKSLQAFVDTAGFGVGLGSSRASSWPIAVVSQFGLPGTLLLGLVILSVVRGLGRYERDLDPEARTTVASVRASALAGLVAGSIISGTADPGTLFFVAYAVVASTRAQAQAAGGRASGRATVDRRGIVKIGPVGT